MSDTNKITRNTNGDMTSLQCYTENSSSFEVE